MAQLFLFCIASALICAAHAANVTFSFPPQTCIQQEGDAYFQNDSLAQLTRHQASGSLSNSYGWITYTERVHLWDKFSGALANFTTHFQFFIGPGEDPSNYGDGLAFFLAPFELAQPLNAYGGGFGIFNATTYEASPYQMVAVEFDTYKNGWDPDDNHVGIDVGSVFSNITHSLSNASATVFNRSDYDSLKNGDQWDAWVDYDGGAKILDVFLLHNPGNNMTKPVRPIMSYAIDLSRFLPESVKVGLSASTGASTETHSITFWNFTYQYLWHVSTPAPTLAPQGQ